MNTPVITIAQNNVNDSHVHFQVYDGPDADHLAHCGSLCMSEEGYCALVLALRGARADGKCQFREIAPDLTCAGELRKKK